MYSRGPRCIWVGSCATYEVIYLLIWVPQILFKKYKNKTVVELLKKMHLYTEESNTWLL